MTVRGAAFLGIGAMVGAGIFALLGEAAVVAGSAVWLSFLLAGVVAALLGYTVVKLGVRYPSSGGLFAYLMQGFGNGRLVGIAAWLGYFAAIVIVCSMVAVAFGSYATSLFVGDDAWGGWDNVFTSIIVVAMAGISMVGSKVVDRAQSLIVVALLAVFAVFIVVTLVDIDFDLLAFSGYPAFSDIVASVALTFFAYLGFSVITFAAGDLRNPKRELPLAMYAALGVTTALYLLISLGVFGTLTVDEAIGYGETAIAEAARPSLGDAGFTMMAVAALLATAVVGERDPLRVRGADRDARPRRAVPELLRTRLATRAARRGADHSRAGARRRQRRRPLRDRVGRQRLLAHDLPPRRGLRVSAALGDGRPRCDRPDGNGGDGDRPRLLRDRHPAQRARDVCRDRRDRPARRRARSRLEAIQTVFADVRRARPASRAGVVTSGDAGSPRASGATLVLLTLAAGQFLMTLDSSVMNVSIATVAKDVGTTVTGIQGAITAYTLVMAALMITGAKIGALIGRKRAFAIGCVIYACGSFTTSLAQSLPVLLFGWSFLEGVGAALILPAIVALVAGNFPVAASAGRVRPGRRGGGRSRSRSAR